MFKKKLGQFTSSSRYFFNCFFFWLSPAKMTFQIDQCTSFWTISLAISLWCMPNHLGPGRNPATVWHEAISTCFLYCCLEIKRRSTEGRWSEKWEKYEKKKGTRLRQRRILNQISRHLESLSAMGAEASSPKTRLGPPNFPAFKFPYFSRRVEGDGRLRA